MGTQRTNVSLSAGDNTVTFHERGQESVRANRDGTFTFSSTGRFFGQGSIGRVVVDLDTGEAVFHTGTNVAFDALCAALFGMVPGSSTRSSPSPAAL